MYKLFGVGVRFGVRIEARLGWLAEVRVIELWRSKYLVRPDLGVSEEGWVGTGGGRWAGVEIIANISEYFVFGIIKCWCIQQRNQFFFAHRQHSMPLWLEEYFEWLLPVWKTKSHLGCCSCKLSKARW